MPATLYRFTVDEYNRMGEAGIFHEDDRVELVDGQIIAMSPIGLPHASCVNRLTQLFAPHAGKAVTLSVQNPIVLSEYDEPQPDVVLLKPRADGYRTHIPGAADILLVIEVSDTTLRHDRSVKVPLYARSGVPESWLVHLGDDVIDVYSDLRDEVYASERLVRRGEVVAPLAVPRASVRADEILE